MGILGADMDVCLHQFGQCNFVSAKHACIFFDEVLAFSCVLCYAKAVFTPNESDSALSQQQVMSFSSDVTFTFV